MSRLRVTIALLSAAMIVSGCTGCGGGSTTGNTGTGTAPGPVLAITQQPVSVTVVDGQAASFSVMASGNAPLTYQWKQGPVLLPGATTASLSIPMAIYTYHNGFQYSVVVTDATGSQVTSQAATLTVTPVLPAITEAPLSQTVSPGSTATFAVSAHGTLPLAYQWELNGVPLSGATAPAYKTSPTSYPADNQKAYTVAVTNGAGQTVLSSPAILTVSQSVVPPTITVDASEADAAVAHQVTYRRGLVEGFDPGTPNPTPSTIVGNVTADIASSGIDFLNATLDLNSGADVGLFDYTPGTPPLLTPDTPGNATLVQTFSLLRSSAPDSILPAAVQVSGTPAAYASGVDPGYQFVCNGTGNFYPLPYTGAPTQLTETAIENWIGSLNASIPGAIWIGTQEPSHTLGYSTAYTTGNCSNPPSSQLSAAQANNIQRFIAYWAPIAQYLRDNHIQSGGVQLNAGDAPLYASTVSQIIATQMKLDFYTVQNYNPSASLNQTLYNAYETFQQDPNYLGVKVIFDRYGTSETGGSYGTAAGVISFLQSEAQIMPYADMLYAYALETSGFQSTSLMPVVLKWLQSAPAPLRPLISTTSNLQAFALVQNSSPSRAYIALWNVSSASHTTSIVLNGFQGSFTIANLDVIKGSGTSVSTISNSGITVNGNTISGLSLAPSEFLLVRLQ